MEDVVLSFGTCAIVVNDVNSKSHKVFEESLLAINITVWLLAQGNHKLMSADKYHFFV